MEIVHGDDVLEVLRTKYERKPSLRFASNPAVGDILFSTGSGGNQQPAILRVQPGLPVNETFIRVSVIYPEHCPVCAPQECIHAIVALVGSVLQTEIDHGSEDSQSRNPSGPS